MVGHELLLAIVALLAKGAPLSQRVGWSSRLRKLLHLRLLRHQLSLHLFLLLHSLHRLSEHGIHVLLVLLHLLREQLLLLLRWRLSDCLLRLLSRLLLHLLLCRHLLRLAEEERMHTL